MNNYNNGFQNQQTGNNPYNGARKKSYKKLIIFLVSTTAVLLVAAVIVAVCVFNSLFSVKTSETYSLPNDKVTSVYAVLGERSMSGVKTSYKDGTTTNIYSYNNISDVGSDITKYITYLHDKEDFLFIQDFDTTPLSGSVYMAKNSSKDGELVLVTVDYNKTSGTYVVTVQSGVGELNIY